MLAIIVVLLVGAVAMFNFVQLQKQTNPQAPVAEAPKPKPKPVTAADKEKSRQDMKSALKGSAKMKKPLTPGQPPEGPEGSGMPSSAVVPKRQKYVPKPSESATSSLWYTDESNTKPAGK